MPTEDEVVEGLGGVDAPSEPSENEDPLSFESTANDFFDEIDLPKEKRAKAKDALRNAIMACMTEDY